MALESHFMVYNIYNFFGCQIYGVKISFVWLFYLVRA